MGGGKRPDATFWETNRANKDVETVKGFWVTYCIGTTLLVIIHIPRTQKWAAGHTVLAVIDAIVRWYVSNRFDEITNSFDYPYTNGPLDGFHTKIKTLKEIHLD